MSLTDRDYFALLADLSQIRPQRIVIIIHVILCAAVGSLVAQHRPDEHSEDLGPLR